MFCLFSLFSRVLTELLSPLQFLPGNTMLAKRPLGYFVGESVVPTTSDVSRFSGGISLEIWVFFKHTLNNHPNLLNKISA